MSKGSRLPKHSLAMKNTLASPATSASLRLRAEEELQRRKPGEGAPLPEADSARLIHELQVHQIELEMQEEELEQARMEAEALLNQYTDLYDFAPSGYMSLSRAGDIQQINLRGARLLGLERSKMISRPFAPFIARESRPILGGFLRDIFASDSSEACEVDLLPAGEELGRVVRIEGVCSPTRQECRAMLLDITERKQAATALRKSEEEFRVMFETASVGMAQADPRTGQWLRVNQKMCAITGYSASEMLGMRVSEITHPDDRQKDWAAFQRVVRGETPDYRMEKRYRHKDGSTVWVKINMTVIRDPAGQPIRTMAVIEDITDQMRAQASHLRLATAVQASADTIVITDEAANILYANPAFEKTSGYTCEEAIGQNPRILKSGKQDAEFYRQMWETLGAGGVWTGRLVNQRKDGKLFQEDASISPIFDGAGRISNYVAVKRDVTREVQLEEQFRQAQKMEAVGQLAGGVAHDFNNLLTVILMQAEMGKGEITSADKREAWEEIIRAADRAASLTRQLLLFSRRQVMRLETLDLNEAVTGLVSMLRRILGEDIQMQLNLHRKPLWTHADAGMIDQVLLNLSVNARDAMPAGGHLIIETAEKTLDAEQAQRNSDATPGCFVVLTVRDTGGGIPPEVLPRIFEPFFTTKDVGKGTGLGLATVFGIVKQHLGWIEVQSAPGEGAIFHIYLPASESPGSAKAVRATKPKSHGGSETILLVEDELAMRKVVRRALQQAGYRVLEAADGPAALSLSGQPGSEIDLLLTDLVMPEGMDGRELAALLLSARTNLKVIFMSGYSPELAGRQITLQPGQEFIQKPCTLDHLLEAVRRCLES